MYIVNGIAYASAAMQDCAIVRVKPLDDWMMILTFSSGEKRLYDATQLFEYPAFQPLKDESIFKAARVDNGIVVWMDGDIDIAPETMYANSYAYEDVSA